MHFSGIGASQETGQSHGTFSTSNPQVQAILSDMLTFLYSYFRISHTSFSLGILVPAVVINTLWAMVNGPVNHFLPRRWTLKYSSSSGTFGDDTNVSLSNQALD